MDAGTALAFAGLAALSCGMVVEVVAIAAIFSYRVRRRLYGYRPPIDHPLSLQSVGCWLCVAGGGIMVLGQWL